MIARLEGPAEAKQDGGEVEAQGVAAACCDSKGSRGSRGKLGIGGRWAPVWKATRAKRWHKRSRMAVRLRHRKLLQPVLIQGDSSERWA